MSVGVAVAVPVELIAEVDDVVGPRGTHNPERKDVSATTGRLQQAF